MNCIVRSRISFFVFLSVSIFSFLGTASAAADRDVVRARLSNGLRVVIVRNTLAPVVSTSVNYLVGSDVAPAGFPGMAHAQEHMMFRGSPGLSADQLANIGSVMGGEFNANTRENLTQYLYTVPSEDLDVALRIEALRMAGVSDSEEAWGKERGAIEQEVAQDLSNPSYMLYQRLRAELFAGTPYEHDALGTRPSFDKTSAAMLKDFHDKWYAPNNAILVIVGDLDLKATLAEVKTLFGPLKAKKLSARPKMTFKQVQAASFSIDTDSSYETQVIAMRLPGLDSRDFPALEVLADVLASHRFRSLRAGRGRQGADRGFLARSAAQGRARLCRGIPAGGRRRQGDRARHARDSDEGRQGRRACRAGGSGQAAGTP